jgi:hypothetical protein
VTIYVESNFALAIALGQEGVAPATGAAAAYALGLLSMEQEVTGSSPARHPTKSPEDQREQLSHLVSGRV